MTKWKYKTRKELEKTIKGSGEIGIILLKRKRINGDKYCVKSLRVAELGAMWTHICVI
jgi:hypothetical protein